jgi:hypothetical protein
MHWSPNRNPLIHIDIPDHSWPQLQQHILGHSGSSAGAFKVKVILMGKMMMRLLAFGRHLQCSIKSNPMGSLTQHLDPIPLHSSFILANFVKSHLPYLHHPYIGQEYAPLMDPSTIIHNNSPAIHFIQPPIPGFQFSGFLMPSIQLNIPISQQFPHSFIQIPQCPSPSVYTDSFQSN